MRGWYGCFMKHAAIVLTERDIVRFLAKVGERDDAGCRRWTSTLGRKGYGEFLIQGKKFYAHRVAWAIAHEDPGDMQVLHRCDTPPCCNVECLFLGTQADNLADMRSKGRQRSGSARGEQNATAKLSESDVLEIRKRYEDGELQVALASSFGVGQTAISRVVLGRTWSHLATE
jgi:hypothetical protein